MILDMIGQIFGWGILATPVVAFLALRKIDMNGIAKFLLGLIIAIILSAALYFISIGIIFRDGMGPG